MSVRYPPPSAVNVNLNEPRPLSATEMEYDCPVQDVVRESTSTVPEGNPPFTVSSGGQPPLDTLLLKRVTVYWRLSLSGCLPVQAHVRVLPLPL